MARIQDILTNVRDILADPNKDRWDDAALLRVLNSGIKEFVLSTECLKDRLFLQLAINTATYDLSNYVLKFNRVQFMEKVIESRTHAEMDKISATWQTDTGPEVKYIVFDTLKEGSVRVYPIPTIGDEVVVQNQAYGALIDIYVNDDIFKIPSLVNADTGMTNYLVCNIVRKPNTVTINTTDAHMEIDSMYDKALEYFVSGHCLRMDSDTLNRQFGAEQIQLYSQYITRGADMVSKASHAVDARSIPYRSFV